MTVSIQNRDDLGRAMRVVLCIIAIGVWLSGGLWLLWHYFLVRQGEFGPETSPLEPWWLKLHGAFAFAAIWMFGFLWSVHITRKWAHRRRRRSGGVLAGVLAFLIVSGYLLYYAGDDRVRPIVSVLHWAIGLVCPLFFAAHRFRLWKRRANQVILSECPVTVGGIGAESLLDSCASENTKALPTAPADSQMQGSDPFASN